MTPKPLRILRDDGPLVLRRRAQRYLARRLARGQRVELPVAIADVLAADWTTRQANDGRRAGPLPEGLRVTWVIPPIAKGSGGHTTLLRFVRALEDSGHRCTLVIYDARGIQTAAEAREIMRRHFPTLRAEVRADTDGLGDCDALFATAWQTAYPVFNARTNALKLYFVQDFEPYFFPVSSDYVLAENTYRFGLQGVTAGRWLSHKLAGEFGMPCEHFEFGSDAGRYRLVNQGRRRKVVFYARPGAPRRGFELGVLALTLFAQQHPECQIHLVGSNDAARYELPFPHVDEGVLTPDELNRLYNEAAAALVMSLTNMSLLPLELLSAGCIPVVNEAESNTLVCDSPHIAYAPPSPQALASRLGQIVARLDLPEYATVAAASVQQFSWEDSARAFEDILLRALARESGALVRSSST